jgi:hypothetical protein
MKRPSCSGVAVSCKLHVLYPCNLQLGAVFDRRPNKFQNETKLVNDVKYLQLGGQKKGRPVARQLQAVAGFVTARPRASVPFLHPPVVVCRGGMLASPF